MTEIKDCLFCKIVAGEVPSQVVATSDLAFAFKDINPTAPVHVLVIPKKHIENAHAVVKDDSDDIIACLELVQEVARLEGVDESGYRVVANVGPDALNSVAHLHFHVIGGRRLQWPPG